MSKSLGFELVAFSGGEPFLRKDLLDLVKYSPLPVSILTNGDLITKKQILELKKINNFKELRFSLDGFETHDIVRKNSNHKKIIEKILYAYFLNLNVSINTMLTKENISDLMKVYDLIDKNLNNIMWRLNHDDYVKLEKKYEAYNIKFAYDGLKITV